MLSIIVLLCGLLADDGILMAQDYKKEFSIACSGSPFGDENNLSLYNDGMSMYDNPLSYIFSDYDGPTYVTGNIIAEFAFLKKKRWVISAAVAANGIWKDCFDSATDGKVGRISGCSVTVMPFVRFNWIDRDYLKLYSSAGFGLTVGSFDEVTESYGTFQLGLLGIQVGRRFFVFAEAGAGSLYMGGKCGVGYRF